MKYFLPVYWKFTLANCPACGAVAIAYLYLVLVLLLLSNMLVTVGFPGVCLLSFTCLSKLSSSYIDYGLYSFLYVIFICFLVAMQSFRYNKCLRLSIILENVFFWRFLCAVNKVSVFFFQAKLRFSFLTSSWERKF